MYDRQRKCVVLYPTDLENAQELFNQGFDRVEISADDGFSQWDGFKGMVEFHHQQLGDLTLSYLQRERNAALLTTTSLLVSAQAGADETVDNMIFGLTRKLAHKLEVWVKKAQEEWAEKE